MSQDARYLWLPWWWHITEGFHERATCCPTPQDSDSLWRNKHSISQAKQSGKTKCALCHREGLVNSIFIQAQVNECYRPVSIFIMTQVTFIEYLLQSKQCSNCSAGASQFNFHNDEIGLFFAPSYREGGWDTETIINPKSHSLSKFKLRLSWPEMELVTTNSSINVS